MTDARLCHSVGVSLLRRAAQKDAPVGERLLAFSPGRAYTMAMSVGLLLSLMTGWLIGGLGNWSADQLPHWPQRPLHLDPRQFLNDWSLASMWRGHSEARAEEGMRQGALWRRPLLTLGTALAFVVGWLRLGDDPWHLGLVWFYSAWLLVVLVIDLEHRRVLNLMLPPAAFVALLASLAATLGFITLPSLANTLIAGGAGFLLFLLIYILGRGQMMGAGDVKLAGVIGLMVGYPTVWTALITGILLGGLGALVLMIRGRANRRSYMAYGPYLALGALITLWFYWP